MRLYDFYWDDGREGFLAYISADKETVEKLLDEYRGKYPEEYDDFEFIEYLKSKGIKVIYVTRYSSNTPVEIDADHHMYF